jgi:hypothetical protein
MRFVRLYTWTSRGGAVFLWAVPLPGPDVRRNGWQHREGNGLLTVKIHNLRNLEGYASDEAPA